MFLDRIEAGQRLVKALPKLDPKGTVILAFPRGGVPVAEVISNATGAPLDIIYVRKVGLPGQPELAIAAVSNGDEPIVEINEDVARRAGLEKGAIHRLAQTELDEIERRRKLYGVSHSPVSVKGKTVVVVDDGIATGATMRAALRHVRKREPARVIAAVPVGPPETTSELRDVCDEVVCLETPRRFYAVGAHYRVFDQVSDAEVSRILQRHPA